MILLLLRRSRAPLQAGCVQQFWNPDFKVPWPWGGAAASSLVSSGLFSSACVDEAIHCPLHVDLILSIAQDQAVLPACQSLQNSYLEVNVVISLAITVNLGDAFPTHLNLLVCLDPRRNHHTDCLVQALGSGWTPKKSLNYGNEEVGVDVCAVPLEHGAFLHPTLLLLAEVGE